MVSTNPNNAAPSRSGDGADSAVDATQDGADRTKPLDVIFLQDTTGSQGPYISAARKAIRDICDKISASGDLSKELIRFGLIAFRDHPPQDRTYVTKNFGFTSDMNKMQADLAGLIASGGGDGPEAQTAALAEALNTEWSQEAIKIVILITDSPPHGLGESGDGFSESPDQNDPLEIARQMAERGITLFVIACEPSLSRYQHAVDLYNAITKITSGGVSPLLMADKLGDYIVGTVIETIETEKLIGEFEKVIMDDISVKQKSVETVAQNLQQFIQDRGVRITTMSVEDIYVPSATAESNTAMWMGSSKVADARGRVKPITAPRIQAQYQPESSYLPQASWGIPGSDASMPEDVLCERIPFEQPQQQTRQMPQVQQMPAVSFGKQAFSRAQAKRVVMSSVSRNSMVTSAGIFSRDGQILVQQQAPSTEAGPST